LDLPLGGLTVILSGTGYQMQPIGEKSLLCSAVDRRNLMHSASPQIRPSTVGAELFSRFVLFELTEQMRTGDADQMALISTLRDPRLTKPIDEEVVQKLTEKQLTEKDIIDDSEWACAPIVVTLNEVRISLNYDMAVRFAKVRRLPIIIWRHLRRTSNQHDRRRNRPIIQTGTWAVGDFCCWSSRIPNSKPQPD
jgi:hypothetical protein